MPAPKQVNALTEHLFRQEAGKLVAVLTRLFGPGYIQLAEDIVQDTLLAATLDWTSGSIPDNPAAWITQVAKRKALNELRRLQTVRKHQDDLTLGQGVTSTEVETIFMDSEIRDSQLRMIFTCCHPALALESQIALTLKTLCGFSVPEVSRALLSSEITINKRLYRAKQKIRNQSIPFDIPSGSDLDIRLNAVCLTLYLLFNEGYNSTHHEVLIRKSLCAEAMRLTRLLTQHFDHRPELQALLALMCFHAARFESRLDRHGAIVIFEEQNRNLWDQQLIATGMSCLKKATTGNLLTSYHLEAGIAAEHCTAPDFASTNWPSIYNQYERLYQLKPSAIIQLNLAIVYSQISTTQDAILRLEQLLHDKALENYYLLPATLGSLYFKTNQRMKAQFYFKKARELTLAQSAIDFFDRQIAACQS